MSSNSSLRITAIALGLGIGATAMHAFAQGTPPPGYQMPPPGVAQPRAPGMRDVFAATLAAVVQSTGVAAASAVSTGLNGAITGWLDKKAQRRAMKSMSYYPTQPGMGQYPGAQPGMTSPQTQGYPTIPGDPNSGYPSTSYPDTTGYPNTGYPNTGTTPGYPTTGDPNASYPSTSYPATGPTPDGAYPGTGYPNTNASDGAYPSTNYPGSTGYPGTSAPSSGYPGAPASGQLYAGFAYEVHALGAGGYAQPIDPASHAFRTGDRFKVVYRPSLPGQVDVYNINAAGQSSHIDTLSVAAGQLAELGPYEFADMKGNETLILSLSPCSSPALMTATRNIVKVPDGASMSGGGAFQLSQCGSPVTRGLRTKTRDIRKVSVESGTSFGLDPLSSAEVSSGEVAPRQITISLQHQ